MAKYDHGVSYTPAASSKNSDPTPSRNEPCTCGSGRKFKKCCMVPKLQLEALKVKSERRRNAERTL